MQKFDPAFLQLIYRMCDSVSNSVAWELVGTPVVGGAWETLVVGAWSMGMEVEGGEWVSWEVGEARADTPFFFDSENSNNPQGGGAH